MTVTALVSLAAGAVLALALPRRYVATAILLPPDERGIPPLTDRDRDSLRLGWRDPGPLEVLETPAGLAARLLRTRPVVEGAMETLAPRGAGSAERARAARALGEGMRCWVTDEKIVVVQAEAEDGRLAAQAANALGESLDRWTRERRGRLAEMRARQLRVRIAALEGEPGDLAPGEAAALHEARLALGRELAAAEAGIDDPRPAIEFVERALPPSSPSRPSRLGVALLVGFAGSLGGCAAAWAREGWSGRGRR